MKLKTPKVIENFLGSFKTTPGGYSARKLSACFAVLVAAKATQYVPEGDRLYVVIAWLVFALLCLSVITFEEIIKFKNGGSTDKTSKQDAESESHIK